VGIERDSRPTVPSHVLGWSVSVSFLAGLFVFPMFALLEYGPDRPLYVSGPFLVVPACVGAFAAALAERGAAIGSRIGLAVGTALVSLAAVSVGALVYNAVKAGLT